LDLALPPSSGWSGLCGELCAGLRAEVWARAAPRVPEAPDHDLRLVVGVVEMGGQAIEVEAPQPGDGAGR
jgi:hypothetical protein